MVRYDRLVSRSLFSVKIVFLYLFHNALTIFTHEKTKEKIIQLFECRWRTIKNEKIMHKLFFITVLCLMPISKKAPFSALETLDDVFYPFMQEKLLWTVVRQRSFTLIAYANQDNFFCCVDCWSFCVLPKEEISV